MTHTYYALVLNFHQPFGNLLALHEALWHILRAETSCNFYWGSRWVHRAFDDLEEAERLISQIPEA